MSGIANTARGAGGKFTRAPMVPAPPDVPDAAPARPATAELHRLAEQRRQHGGFLIPPPADAAQAGFTFSAQEGMERPNAALQGVLKWFEAVVEAGGSDADLALAWESGWRLTGSLGATIKGWARPSFEALQARAGKRYAELEARAYAEAAPDRAALERRRQLQAERHELAAIEADAAKVRARIARLEA
jgi:hypothetical protein